MSLAIVSEAIISIGGEEGDMLGRGWDEWHKPWGYEDKTMRLNLFISLPKH